MIVDLIDTPERAGTQEPPKVPPRRRTPPPASHATARLVPIAPARLTARAHADLSPRGRITSLALTSTAALCRRAPRSTRDASARPPPPLPRRRRSAHPLRQLRWPRPSSLISRLVSAAGCSAWDVKNIHPPCRRLSAVRHVPALTTRMPTPTPRAGRERRYRCRLQRRRRPRLHHRRRHRS